MLVKFSNLSIEFLLSKISANIDMQYVELKTPAQPHAFSLVSI